MKIPCTGWLAKAVMLPYTYSSIIKGPLGKTKPINITYLMWRPIIDLKESLRLLEELDPLSVPVE